MRVLDDLRVLDLSAGPVGGAATAVLADFGADVLKVERPGGDPQRRLAASPLWLRGKRSTVLDLDREIDRSRLQELARGAAVVVSTFRPGSAKRLGADYETLSAANPGLVYCAITGWGPRGPYARFPAYEGLIAAKSGRMTSFAGQRPREGPGFAALPVASHAAAQGAVHGICAALIAREQSGRGALIETSLLQGIGLYDLFQLLTVQLARRDGDREPPVPIGGMPTLNYHPVMAGDGRWIQLGNLLEHLFYAFLDATDLLPELISEKRFQGAPERWSAAAVEEARDRILERMQERSAHEWMKRFRANGHVAAEPFGTAKDALHHPDIVANGDIVSHEHPKLGPVRQIGPLATLTATPGSATRPAPEVGEHAAVWRSPEPAPQSTKSATQSATKRGGRRGQPLAGTTVADFSTIIAGPLAMSILADLGARVIKIEPVTGDPSRGLGPLGLLAAKTNAAKESLCVDLKSDAGREIIARLLPRVDAVVHNYRPGVPERLGISYEQARDARPDVVWVSANGYGPGCPSAGRPATHPIPGAATGGALFQAGAGMPPEHCAGLPEIREAARQLMRANEPNPDPNTSAVIASATLLALLARLRHGVGQAVYVNMLAANAWANLDDFLDYDGKPQRPTVDSGQHGLSALYRLYPAREGWIFLAAPRDHEWRALCETATWDDLAADARFATEAARRNCDGELAALVADRVAARTADDWEHLLATAGIGCVRADATTPGRFFADDEHVHANGFAPESDHARLGRLRRWGPLVTCDGGPEHYGAGVLAGADTDSLLAELGYSDDDVQRFRADGAVGSEPV